MKFCNGFDLELEILLDFCYHGCRFEGYVQLSEHKHSGDLRMIFEA